MSAFTDKVLEATKKAIVDGRPRPQVPEPLYHFTDVTALKAIVTTRKIRASLATSLNDASEGSYGLTLALRMLRERSIEEGSYEDMLVNVIESPTSLPGFLQYDMFPLVVCFCASNDTSSQWMHYGRSGRGVAIGFNPKSLEQVTGLALWKIDYDLVSQRRRIQAVIDAGRAVFESDKQAVQSDLGVGAMTAAHVVWLQLRLLAAELKHPSFSCEDEWRLLGHEVSSSGKLLSNEASSKGPIEHRISDDGRLVPYKDLPLPDSEDVIASVVLGYSSSLDINAVKLLLLDRTLRARVLRSEVPVR